MIVMNLSWMAWTMPTAIFFGSIAGTLLLMTLWEKIRPTIRRRGLLPFATTRGDRFFLGLLLGAFLHLAWLGLRAAPIWFATALWLLCLPALLRWG